MLTVIYLVIELHATFLELNLLSQIRALPNPSYATGSPYPLTLHLSPTSTANIVVSSLTPPLPSTSPFAKVAPDAEVIVAPKTRPHISRNNLTESGSNASTSRKSAGGRSSRQRGQREEKSIRKAAIFLRAIDRMVCNEWFDEDDDQHGNEGIRAWIDREILMSKALRGAEWVSISIVHPAGLETPMDVQVLQRRKDQEGSDAGKHASVIVAKVSVWDDAVDSRHIALSSTLCSVFGVRGIVGGLVRIEAAPPQASSGSVKRLKVFPFLAKGTQQNAGFRFGGESKASREAAAQRIRETYGRKDQGHEDILAGPLTDGLILSKLDKTSPIERWEGGLLRFDPAVLNSAGTSESQPLRWIQGSKSSLVIEVEHEISNPHDAFKSSAIEADALPSVIPSMISMDSLIKQLFSHLSHCSSVLLTGGLGSGKTSMSQLLAYRLQYSKFYHTTYFPCRKLVTDETRTSTIKEVLNRILMTASWGTRLGGRAIVILDDLDKLCPIETELQVGNDNSRSRHVSELVCAMVQQYCRPDSGVVLLATAQSKESLNKVIVGGHVVREIIGLKVPDKDGRRQVLQALVGQPQQTGSMLNGPEGQQYTLDDGDEAAWMDGSVPGSRPGSSTGSGGPLIDRDLDFLDLAGQTDGYMPGDLVLLISRAKSEALIRSVELSSDMLEDTSIHLGKEDFQKALKDFMPASLRNVTLQSSKTTFASIGGLYDTRKILLETLQYPTTYAPIFANCPLRLRSGLLLYGYPGCGKTLLASAVAGECGLNFISVKGPEILNKYIGASEKSVRDLFERAEAARPCVLFFDEFDSIAPKRGHDSTGVTDRVVNQLLTQMDGAEGLSGVYVLAATSRPDLIDPALLRPGRLDKSLICDLPSLDDRVDILLALSKKLNLSPKVLEGPIHHESLSEVARRTEGYSGADLQAVIYNAHLEAIHDVLGDHSAAGKTNGTKPNPSKNSTKSPPSHSTFLQFRYGSDLDSKDPILLPTNQSTPPALIAAKLSALKLAKRKERHLLRSVDASTSNPKHAANDTDGKTRPQEVIIQWPHIEASLAVTRSSVSNEERRRLEGIYREFVVGRNGEMPSGQGPTEVGGRSSLM